MKQNSYILIVLLIIKLGGVVNNFEGDTANNISLLRLFDHSRGG